MAAATREYELVLMLDPGRDAPARDAVAKEVKAQIEAGGTLKHENVWGLRKLAYEIKQRTEADYRWFRFEAPTDLLEQLDHNLKIADGVLRFRIFKVDPEAPVMVPPATGSGPRERSEPASGGARPAPAEAPPAADAEAPPAAEAEAAPAEQAEAEAPAPQAAETEPAEPPAPEASEPAAAEADGGESAE